MEIEDRSKMWALISAFILGALGLYRAIIIISYLQSDVSIVTPRWVLDACALFVLAAALAINNKKLLVFAASAKGILNFWKALEYVINSRLDAFFFGFLACLFSAIAYAVLAAVTVYAIKKNQIVAKTWFSPGILFLISVLLEFMDSPYVFGLLFPVVELIALLFAGLWLKAPFEPEPSTQTNGYAAFNPQAARGTPEGAQAIGGADKLKMYKELFDSGVITQEEFEQKKKQILGT